MKLTRPHTGDKVELSVFTTNGDELKSFHFPKNHIYFWYPFNINFFYKYSNSREFMYLVKEKGYEGENVYNIDILKRTKPMPTRNDVPFHKGVYQRNMYIMSKAKEVGLVTIKDVYSISDVKENYIKLKNILTIIKNEMQDRYLDKYPEDVENIGEDEEWIKKIYSEMTPEEHKHFIEIGEMYVMVNLMRKLAEEE